MNQHRSSRGALLFFSLAFNLCFINSNPNSVEYKGRKYVLEGNSFDITCLRSAFGVPKWTKDGSTIIPDHENNYTLKAAEFDTNMILMELHVDYAEAKHRGEYKCDSLSPNFHRMEIVPSEESDENYKQASVQLKLNETLELFCAELDSSVFSISWYKDGHRILESDDRRYAMDDRTLYIDTATELDAGQYFCAVEVTGLSYPAADHLGYYIQVTHPARVDAFPPQIRPILGRNLTLECKVHGYPVPRVTWIIDGISSDFFEYNSSRICILDNDEGLPNAVLFIENVTYEDEREFQCTAENARGIMTTSVTLAVRDSMIDTNEERPDLGIILAPGHDLVLQCNTTDNPSLDVTWYKNGFPVNQTDIRIKVENNNNSLIIHHSSESDAGNYMCVANTKEFINATIVVRTRVKLAPFDNSRNIVQGQNIFLHCDVIQGSPLPSLVWLKDDKPLNLSDSRIDTQVDSKGIADSKITIKNADYNDRGIYTCKAENLAGPANSTILIRIKDKYAALWPFLGICVEVAVLCTIIFVYERKRQKPDFDESEGEHPAENKSVPDQEDKSQDVRQRK